MSQVSTPSCWRDKEANRIVNEARFDVEDLFHRQMKQGQYVPEVHIPTRGSRPFCVDFYTYGTLESGVNDRTN